MSALHDAYGRLLQASARWGFDPVRLRQHLRTAFAACLALLAAWQLGLEHPQWAAMAKPGDMPGHGFGPLGGIFDDENAHASSCPVRPRTGGRGGTGGTRGVPP